MACMTSQFVVKAPKHNLYMRMKQASESHALICTGAFAKGSCGIRDFTRIGHQVSGENTTNSSSYARSYDHDEHEDVLE